MSTTKKRPLFFFYVLVIYVLIQFIWWGCLLINLNNQIYELKSSINLLQHENPSLVIEKGNELEQKLHLKWIMIVGEGLVFLILLIFGVARVINTHKKETELASRQKNFLLSVTHELKSPIASVKIAIETLLKRELSKEKQTEILQHALADTERLNQLVENILTAAKIDEGKHSFSLRETNLSELIKITLNPYIATNNIQYDIEENIYCAIDSFSFPSIIQNLLDNAIKYSANNELISISLKKINTSVVLTVNDNGVGIPENEKEKIFEKFYRIGSEETRNAKGTGLGLYIVKYLVDKHKGIITIKNNQPKGTTFEIRFN